MLSLLMAAVTIVALGDSTTAGTPAFKSPGGALINTCSRPFAARREASSFTGYS